MLLWRLISFFTAILFRGLRYKVKIVEPKEAVERLKSAGSR